MVQTRIIINNLEAFKTRNYYPRPTFPDMQFEERNQYTQASYTSGTIYEWNIDGMTEYNILYIYIYIYLNKNMLVQ